MTTGQIHNVLAQLLNDDDALADRNRQLSTGFRALDEVLAGGLRTGQTAIFASPTSEGATTFALDIARLTALHHRLPTIVLAPDTPEREIVLRLIAAETTVPALSLRSSQLSPRDETRVRDHRSRLAEAPISINAGSHQVWGPEVFLDSLDYMTRDVAVRLAVIHGVSRLGPSLRTVLPLMSALSRARHFALVLVAGARSPDGPTSSRSPVLEHLRDHESIADLVDLVLMVQREDPGEARIKVVKHRFGPTATVPIGFLHRSCTFTDMDL